MGQYYLPVNLTKREFVDPHKLGAGLKICEQLGTHVGSALVVLLASHPEPRGGGDFCMDEPMPHLSGSTEEIPSNYPEVAKRTIGRWAGDQIAIVGDYAEDSDLPAAFEASKIFRGCRGVDEEGNPVPPTYRDITEDVVVIIEHEAGVKFKGKGWREVVNA